VNSPLPPAHRRLFLLLGSLYAAWWVTLAIAPKHPFDWWLENILVITGLLLLILTARRFVFSRLSYFLIFLFLCLHTLGAHYTYSEVPYRAWFESLGLRGTAPPFDAADPARNHFDRLVHFLYGLLLTLPFREAFYFAVVPKSAFWSYLIILSFNMATSLLYELLEWAVVEIWGGELGLAFLGAQGDPWDAHKDMLLAAMGCLLCFALMLLVQALSGRDFAREWGERRRKGWLTTR
jgi:putative membrane protein